jgi:Flp pilus assembly protein TadD
MGVFGKLFKGGGAAAEAHFQNGAELGKRQQWGPAKAELLEAVKLNPKHVKAHMALAMAYGALMDMDSAKRHFSKLKELDPALARQFENTPAGTLILHSGGVIIM